MNKLLIFALTACCLLGMVVINNCNARSLDDIQRDLDSLVKKQTSLEYSYKQMEFKKSLLYVVGAFAVSFGFGYALTTLMNKNNQKKIKNLETQGIAAIPKVAQKRFERKGARSDDDVVEMFKEVLKKQPSPLLGGAIYSIAFGGFAIYLLFFR